MPKFTRLPQQTGYLRFIPGLIILTSILTSSIVQAVPVVDSREFIPKPLVLRLLKCPGECVKNMQLLVGQLPDKMPVQLPLPGNAKVVATLIRDQNRSEIVLDAPQSPEQIQSFYRTSLASAGWKALRLTQSEGLGFLASEDRNLSLPGTFCKSNQGPELQISAAREGDKPTDVRLYLETTSELCANLAESTEQELRSQELLPMPRLTAPADAQVSATGLRPGEESFITTAKITTLSSRDALYAAYADQLTQAKWSKQTVSKEGQTLSSLWTLTDQEGQRWQGILNISPIEGKSNEYFASLILLK